MIDKPYQKYLCLACGWVYDEALGDPDGGLPAGTRFEDIPNDWSCPLCGVSKKDFVLMQDTNDAPKGVSAPKDGGVVIVGAGQAAWSVVDAIRQKDSNIAITIITADSGARYLKPMLSASLSQNKQKADLVRKSGEVAASEANITLLSDTFVLDVDTEHKIVETTRANIPYTALVLATGARLFVPDGIDKTLVYHVNHLDDYAKLLDALQDGSKRVGIIGAGLVGVEIAEDIAKAGHKATLFGLSDTPLPEILPKQAGLRLIDALQSNNIDYHKACVSSIQTSGTKRVITCDKGQRYDFDVVILATGLMPDNALARKMGLKFLPREGIVVDKYMQTSLKNIYAIGDCAAIEGKACRFIAPHRTGASTIAGCILGQDNPYIHAHPLIRLKNKSIMIKATGNTAFLGDWTTISEDEKTLIMHKKDGDDVVATLEVILP